MARAEIITVAKNAADAWRGTETSRGGYLMDIEKLIEDLRVACAGNQHNIMGVAATALSTLQAENEKLRAAPSPSVIVV